MIDQGEGIVEMCLPTCCGESCRRWTPVLFFSCQDTRRYEASPRKPGYLAIPLEVGETPGS